MPSEHNSEVENVASEPPGVGYQPPLEGVNGSSFVLQQFRSHQGPLPAVEDLAGYQSIDPTFPAEILAMAKKEQDHRHAMDRAELKESTDAVRRGQGLGFSIALVLLLLSGLMVVLGYSVEGTILGTLDLVALVTVFVKSGRSSEE